MEKSKAMSGPILVLGLVQLIESLAFALPLSFFPNYVLGLPLPAWVSSQVASWSPSQS